MKVFLTGATGFIGKYVLSEMHAAKHDILALALEETGTEIKPANVQWLYGDIADLRSLRTKIRSFNPEAVVHLAWQGIPD